MNGEIRWQATIDLDIYLSNHGEAQRVLAEILRTLEEMPGVNASPPGQTAMVGTFHRLTGWSLSSS